MPRVLVTEPIDPAGVAILSQVAQVDQRHNLSPEELKACIGAYDGLLVRSATKVTQDVITAGHNLKIIGRAGVGVDNIDVPAATRQGIVVVNSPEGNTIAAAEHTIALMLALSRYVPQANQMVKAGEWNRKEFLGVEVYKKTLGIVGLGKIGSHVATIARAMGMRLLAYDPFISQERAEQLGCTLMELEVLLREADYITLHIPKTPDTTHLINRESFKKMKPHQADFQLPQEEGFQQRLVTRLLDGMYPNYRQLLPREFARRVVMEREDVIHALERLAVLAGSRNVVKFSLDLDTVILATEGGELGQGQEQIPAEIEGEALEVAFNVKYVLEGLKAMSTSQVQMQLNSATAPVIFSPLGDVKMTYLVMPIQLRG